MDNSGAWVRGYVLHLRPYRETSAIAEILTQEHGRIGAVVRGLKKKRPNQSLQPFQRYVLTWRGQRELVNLSAWEPDDRGLRLQGTALVSAMYVNELLVKLTERQDPHEGMFEAYQKVLEQLAKDESPELPLRVFEKRLLASLGYGLDIDSRIEPDRDYTFSLERGIEPAQRERLDDSTRVSGETLLALHRENLDGKQQLREAKHLMRGVLEQLLGGRQLVSRSLLR